MLLYVSLKIDERGFLDKVGRFFLYSQKESLITLKFTVALSHYILRCFFRKAAS